MTGDRHLPGFVARTQFTGTVETCEVRIPGDIEITVRGGSAKDVLAALYRIANGPQAPSRKRRRRLAKKIARRGGLLRTRGLTQFYLQAWPEMQEWY